MVASAAASHKSRRRVIFSPGCGLLKRRECRITMHFHIHSSLERGFARLHVYVSYLVAARLAYGIYSLLPLETAIKDKMSYGHGRFAVFFPGVAWMKTQLIICFTVDQF